MVKNHFHILVFDLSNGHNLYYKTLFWKCNPIWLWYFFFKKIMVWTRFCPPKLDAKIWDTLRLPTLKVAIKFESLENASFWLPHTLTISYWGCVCIIFHSIYVSILFLAQSWKKHYVFLQPRKDILLSILRIHLAPN